MYESAEKLIHIKELYEALMDTTETFSVIGADLFYLVGAIVEGSVIELHTDDTTQAELIGLFEEIFLDDHWVWEYVDVHDGT